MTILDPGRRAFVAGGALAGAAMLTAGPAHAQGRATRMRDDTPFTPPPVPPPALTAPASVATLDGVDLWYWDTGGAGPAVVLHHAMTGSGHVWGYQQQAFQKAGYRVIGYSRRGYRGSTAGDPARLGTAVEDMRMLLDHLKVERCHAIGTAGGGLVAGGFALHYPARTLSITLSCTILTLTDPKVSALMETISQPWYRALPHDFTELSPSYRALCKEGQAIWADLAHQARAERGLPAQPYGGPASLAEIAAIRAPTLLVYGDADPAASPPVGRLFAQTIRGSEFLCLAECGHSAYWERPDLFNAAVLDFMKRRGA